MVAIIAALVMRVMRHSSIAVAVVTRNGMTIETPFANKVTGPEDTDDCFLAPLRNDGELDFALLDVKNCVSNGAL
jgi:hypothetical protein